MKKYLVLSLFLLSVSSAYAGGDAWKFNVQKLSEEGGGHVAYLVPERRSAQFPENCKALTVHIRFNPRWWSPDWRRLVTKEKHKDAIKLLKDSEKSGAPVVFGAMGEGFQHKKSSACEVESRALSVITSSDGSKEIYSFYKWP